MSSLDGPAPCPFCGVVNCPGGPGHQAADLGKVQFEEWAGPPGTGIRREEPPVTKVIPGHKDYRDPIPPTPAVEDDATPDVAETLTEPSPDETPAAGPEETGTDPGPDETPDAGPAEAPEGPGQGRARRR